MPTIAPILFFSALVLGAVVWVVISRQRQSSSWQEFAGQVGGEYVPGRLLQSPSIQLRVGTQLVTLETYSVPSGDSSTTYTRFRTPLPAADGFEFRIHRQGLVARLDKALGTKHIDVGDPDFDRDFMVQASDPGRLQGLLSDVSLRQYIQAQRSLDLLARKGELRLESVGFITDLERLGAMFTLFKTVLARLGG